MLKWREDYYVGEGIKDAAKARRRSDAGRVAFGVYLEHYHALLCGHSV